MVSTSRITLRALLLAGAVSAVAPGLLVACDPAWLPIARIPGMVYFTAVAVGDTVLDTTAERKPAEDQTQYAFDVTREVPGRTRGGQRVRLDKVSAGIPSIGGSNEAIVVPWAFGSDCSPIPWSGSLIWIRPGMKGFITAWLRPKQQWIGNIPTFDVAMAWREPLWRAGDSRWPHPAPNGLLDPDQFLELYAALPDYERMRRSPGPAIADLKQWERKHVELARREPARTILNNAYRSASSNDM